MTQFIKGDRVRVDFRGRFGKYKHDRPYNGTIIGAFNADFGIWRVQPDDRTKPDLINAVYIRRIATPEGVAA